MLTTGRFVGANPFPRAVASSAPQGSRLLRRRREPTLAGRQEAARCPPRAVASLAPSSCTARAVGSSSSGGVRPTLWGPRDRPRFVTSRAARWSSSSPGGSQEPSASSTGITTACLFAAAIGGALAAAVTIQWLSPGAVFRPSSGRMNVLVIGLGPGPTGRVDFKTASRTFHQDLDIEPGTTEAIDCTLGAARVEVVLNPGRDDGRVDVVQARVWSAVAKPKGDEWHRWRQVRLLPDREQCMELQWL